MLLAYGFLARVFEIFNKYKISIDLISTSEVTVSMTLDNLGNGQKELEQAIRELEKIGKVELLKDMSIICIVGKNIKENSKILGRIFNVCKTKDVNVEMISQGASPLSISFVVKQGDSDKIIKELHKELFEDE